MKKVLTVLGVLVVVLGQLFDGAPEWAEAGGELPPCQDINDDGSSDVSDAVFFLQWQFLGGPEPSCPTSNGLPAGLPDTGQTMCSTAGGELGCGQIFSVTCPPFVQDARLQTGCPNDANRFTDNADDTVTDNCTGLQWERTPRDSDGNGVSDILTWCAALAYCENLSLAGHDDWRLPNVREVQSIVDYGRPPDDPIDPVFGGSRDNYWSSTSGAEFPSLAWTVGPLGGVAGGSVNEVQKTSLKHVRAVRGAERVGGGAGNSLPPCQDINGDGAIDLSDAVYFLQWRFLGGPPPTCPTSNGQTAGLPDTGQTKCYDLGAELSCGAASPSCPVQGQDGPLDTGCPNDANRFTDNADDTVTDNCTGLQWQRTPPDTDGNGISDRFTWCAALVYCGNLSLAGHDDWRLPNVRELQSLVDYGRVDDTVLDPLFNGVRATYWSSTYSTFNPREAWTVEFRPDLAGLVRPLPKSEIETDFVRAVRGG